jgi:hypothetical protein
MCSLNFLQGPKCNGYKWRLDLLHSTSSSPILSINWKTSIHVIVDIIMKCWILKQYSTIRGLQLCIREVKMVNFALVNVKQFCKSRVQNNSRYNCFMSNNKTYLPIHFWFMVKFVVSKRNGPKMVQVGLC